MVMLKGVVAVKMRLPSEHLRLELVRVLAARAETTDRPSRAGGGGEFHSLVLERLSFWVSQYKFIL